jgi:hypothetical protein
MPIAQIMLFGFAITNEINNVNIAILDKSKDTETEIIIKISASNFHIKQTISTESEIESIFKKENKSSIGFRKSFCEKTYKLKKQAKVQVIADATDPYCQHHNELCQCYSAKPRTRNKQSKPASLSNTNPNSIVLQSGT